MIISNGTRYTTKTIIEWDKLIQINVINKTTNNQTIYPHTAYSPCLLHGLAVVNSNASVSPLLWMTSPDHITHYAATIVIMYHSDQ